MFNKLVYLTFFIVFPFLNTVNGQILEINKDGDSKSSFNPEQLIEQVLISGDCANVSNFISQSNGSPSQNRIKSYGYFNRPTGSSFPFKEGVILTSGRAYNAGNNSTNVDLSYSQSGWGGDDDLKDALMISQELSNATHIEFDFVPTSTEISFRYIMASEEYTGDYPCTFSDSFAFLLKKSGDVNFQNLAVIPETTTPVSVVNVHPKILEGMGCQEKNEQYFAGYNMGETNYNGRTTVLTAQATVIPNEMYHIKLVVADAQDDQYDTAVFLEAGSFSLGLDLGDDLLKSSNSAACGNTQLLESNVSSTSYKWYKDNVIIPGENSKTYLANLGDGVYKVEIESGASCVAFDEVVVEFAKAPSVASNITPLYACDDDNDGTVSTNLTQKDAEILDGQSSTLFEVIYYSDSLYQNPIPDPANFLLNSASVDVYVSVRNKESTNCTVNSQFTIIRTQVPEITKPTNYEVCDDVASGSDTDGFFSSFDLQSKISEILDPADTATVNISFYRTQSDADLTNNPIVNTTNYINEIKHVQPIIVRIEDKTNPDCFKTTSFDLVINELPNVTSTTLKQCDTDSDGLSAFNLTEANGKISSNAINETFTYYTSFTNADTESNPIPDPTNFTNISASTDEVWAVIKTNKNCSRIAKVDLTVSTTNIPSSFIRTFNSCDDYLDFEGNDNANNNDTDGITSFDFSSATNDILALFPSSGQQIIVTYYRNEADALAERNKIKDPSNYRNIGYAFTQDIYVRVDNDLDNDCLGLGPHIKLTVDPVPVLQDLNDLALCDDAVDGDDKNGKVYGFDLNSQTAKLLGSLSAGYNVSYHLSQSEADSGSNPQSSPFTNTIRDRQTIYSRVVNPSTGCINTHNTFDVVVNALPQTPTLKPLEICDDDSDGSAITGFSQNINLDSKLTDILGPDQDPKDYSVTYHLTLFDAQNNAPSLTSPFTNTVPYRQTINVRIQENVSSTACVSYSQFDILVHPKPESNVIPTIELCDDDTDGDDMNGIVQKFDLDAKIDQILGPSQSQTDYKVTFHHTQAEATNGNNPLVSLYTNTIRDRQTIYVRVLNIDTNCFNDSEKFDIVVHPLPVIEVKSPQFFCLNTIPSKINIQVPTEQYTYTWYDPEGYIIANGYKAFVTSGGDYTVIAKKTDGTGCEKSLTVKINESNLSSLTEKDIEIIDDSNNNTIKINLENVGIGDYEFALEDDSFSIIKPFQDSPVFSNLLGGIYTVLVRDKNGCGVIRIKVSVLSPPRFFTPNDDGYNDTWSIRGINLDFYSQSSLYIFDRYGKLLKQLDPTQNESWDGTYLGKQLPSDDYWFTIELVKINGETRLVKGHFSLKR